MQTARWPVKFAGTASVYPPGATEPTGGSHRPPTTTAADVRSTPLSHVHLAPLASANPSLPRHIPVYVNPPAFCLSHPMSPHVGLSHADRADPLPLANRPTVTTLARRHRGISAQRALHHCRIRSFRPLVPKLQHPRQPT